MSNGQRPPAQSQERDDCHGGAGGSEDDASEHSEASHANGASRRSGSRESV